MKKHGFGQAQKTDGLFTQVLRDISFTLVVDDFGIKFTNEQDCDYLIKIMREKYKFKVDYEAKQYIGIHLKWDYVKREVVCSMEGYITKALKELEHIFPKKHYYRPSNTRPPTYGFKIQYVKEDLSKPQTPSQFKEVERIVGKFLYYARAIDNTMAHMMNHIGSQKNKGIQKLMQAITYFLNYAASNPSAKIIYCKSDMLYKVDSDAVYLVCPDERSRAGDYHYLGNADNKLFNGPIYILATIIKNVMAAAAEAEVAGLFMNANKAIPIRHTLI